MATVHAFIIMGKFKELSIDESNDLLEIASNIEEVKSKIDKFMSSYNRFRVSNGVSSSQDEIGFRLNINEGTVNFLEMTAKQLMVQFR